MKIQYLGQVAIASLVSISLAAGHSRLNASNGKSVDFNSQVTTQIAADPYAAVAPDAGADPCAAIAPDAAAEPGAQTTLASAVRPSVYQENGIAIGGTDPVAYFRQGQPVAGSANYEHRWRSTTWRFSSAENRDLFASNPEQYAPQYGGYCAWAVSQGYTASTIPEAWKIVDGKLYLNYSTRVQRSWEGDTSGHIARADRNWPGVLEN
jgi:YHS domain-containing protein